MDCQEACGRKCKVITIAAEVTKSLQTMTGRIVMSSYETLRSAGTSVVCLSPVSHAD